MVRGVAPVSGPRRNESRQRADGTYRPSSRAESRFLAAYDAAGFPPVAVTVDVVVLTIRQGQLCVLLVERGDHPYRGAWALPGGFVTPEEDLAEAARRELAEEAGLELPVTGGAAGHIEQLATYGSPLRDPRMRVVSVAYLALLSGLPPPTAGEGAEQAHFWPVEDIDLRDGAFLGSGPELAFDHHLIVADGVARARAKLEYTSLATSFVEAPFTLGELRRVYEAVWGVALHRQNFTRKVLATTGFVVPVGRKRPSSAAGGRPAELYRPGDAVELHPPLRRSDHR